MADPFNRLRDCPLDGECPPICRSVFDRVVVSYLIAGGTRVMWELLDTFTDPGPLRFQLQVGNTHSNDAGDWVDVGLPVTDAYVAFDDEQRIWSKMANWTHYRIELTTSLGTYLSDPTAGLGVLDRRMWRIARETVRSKLVAFRVGVAGQRGFLLKRRITGENCPTCLDYQTMEVRNPDCPDCYGTGKKCGYYYPVSCVWAEMEPKAYHLNQDVTTRGTVKDMACRATMIMTDLLSEEDVWVSEESDDRYFVHEIQHTFEVKGVPILANATLRPVPYSHVIYTIPIPEQLRGKEAEA